LTSQQRIRDLRQKIWDLEADKNEFSYLKDKALRVLSPYFVRDNVLTHFSTYWDLIYRWYTKPRYSACTLHLIYYDQLLLTFKKYADGSITFDNFSSLLEDSKHNFENFYKELKKELESAKLEYLHLCQENGIPD